MSHETTEERKIAVNFAEQGITPKEVGHAWTLMTEAIKREIPTNQNLRAVALQFVSSPVSQRLSFDFFSALSTESVFLKRLGARYEQILVHLLQLPEIPEQIFSRDLRNAFVMDDNWEFQKGDLNIGVTRDELRLTVMRYRFARDVKMLALMAELASKPLSLVPGTTETTTDHGIVIGGDPHAPERNLLLEPMNWQYRRQLKDRVYEMGVGDQKFILKERKTARHMDTLKNGHRDGLTSKQEFETAHELQQYSAEHDDVILRWERPMGYVLFPDGFQFVIFEHIDNIWESGNVNTLRQKLTDALLENKTKLQAEYDRFYPQALKLVTDPRTDPYYHGKMKRSLLDRMGLSSILRRSKEIPYSLEQFARVKAMHMFHEVNKLRSQGMKKGGYHNGDKDGYFYRLHVGTTVRLEEIAMDFEYLYKEDPEEEALIAERQKAFDARFPRSPLGFANWDDEHPVTRMDIAFMLAMGQ